MTQYTMDFNAEIRYPHPTKQNLAPIIFTVVIITPTSMEYYLKCDCCIIYENQIYTICSLLSELMWPTVYNVHILGESMLGLIDINQGYSMLIQG